MLGQPLDPSLMRTFDAVVEEGSYTRAGARVGLTQQAVSAQMKRLEIMLGRPIFVRDDRGRNLTADGEALHAYVRRALRLAEQIGLQLSRIPLAGIVRFGMIEAFASTGLPAVLAAARLQEERIALRVDVGSAPHLLAKLASHQLDMILGSQLPNRRNGEPLWRERHNWVGRGFETPSASSPLPLAVRHAPSLTRSVTVEALGDAGIPYEIVFESDSLSALRTAISSGFAIGVMADSERQGEPILSHGLPQLPDIEAFVMIGDTDRSGVSLLDELVRKATETS